jgi:signal transduction histidine kinase
MSYNILVVDDSDILRDGIKLILQMEKHTVFEAANGKQALEVLSQIPPPDLIISDIVMPQMNGFDFYDKLRKNDKFKAIPFIFLTARGQKEDIIRGKEMGVEDYLIKPFDTDQLLATVNGKIKRMQEISDVYSSQVDELREAIMRQFSHEMRTPLTVIEGCTEFLETVKSTENLAKILKAIRSSSHRLSRIMERGILLTSLESPKEIRKYGGGSYPHAVERSIISTIENSQKVYPNIDFEFNVDPSDLRVDIPSDLFMPLLQEIVDNACKFSQLGLKADSSESKKVWIRAGKVDDKFCVITVKDEGIGVPEDSIFRLTEKFYQYNREKYEQQGIGIGLTIVEKIISFVQGKLEISSDLGDGMTVKAYLPVNGYSAK